MEESGGPLRRYGVSAHERVADGRDLCGGVEKKRRREVAGGESESSSEDKPAREHELLLASNGGNTRPGSEWWPQQLIFDRRAHGDMLCCTRSTKAWWQAGCKAMAKRRHIVFVGTIILVVRRVMVDTNTCHPYRLITSFKMPVSPYCCMRRARLAAQSQHQRPIARARSRCHTMTPLGFAPPTPHQGTVQSMTRR